MKPIEFKEQNIVFAKDQDEYLDLPAYKEKKSPGGEVVTCHRLSWRERIKVLFFGKVWLMQMTFHQPLQPIRMEVDKWEMLNKEHFKNMMLFISALLIVSCEKPETFDCECKEYVAQGKPVNIRPCYTGEGDNVSKTTVLSYEQALAMGKKQNCPQ